MENSDRSFAVVTPTYLPDLARCELLADSLDRMAPHIPHYLIVDRRERLIFTDLEGGRRRLLQSESPFGERVWGVSSGQTLWLDPRAPPAARRGLHPNPI